MSQPTEIRKSILILKSQAKGLTAVEAFLRNREWHIHSTSDLKAALVYLVQNKPSFVMISVDHPNKKVRNLPKLLGQAFPVFVMAFSESSTAASYKNLVESGTNYRINPPVTGPAVERTINKIIRDQQVEQEKRERAAREGGEANSATDTNGDRITISGASGSTGEGGAAISDHAADIIRRMMGESADSEADSSSAEPGTLSIASGEGGGALLGSESGEPAGNSSGPMILGQSLPNQREALILDPGAEIRRPGVDPDFVSSENGEAPSVMIAKGQRGELHQTSQDELGAAPGFAPQFGEGDPGGVAPAMIQPGMKSRSMASTQDPTSSSGMDPLMPDQQNDGEGGAILSSSTPRKQARLSADRPQALYAEEDFEGRGAGEGQQGEAGEAPQMGTLGTPHARRQGAHESAAGESRGSDPHHAAGALNQNVHKIGQSGSRGWEKSDSIIVRGTQRALDESVEVKDHSRPEETVRIESATNVACLIVESPKFSGYLVAALGKNRKVDEKFVNVIRDRLFRFLRENGEDVEAENNMSLNIKKVDFEDWALEYADFLRKSVHDGEEIAMAFFPFADAKTDITDSASVDMGAVKMEDLQGDVSVEFNLYIYLPSNKKYVLYTPRDSTFYGNQKERLSRMGVTHMHVKKTELQDVSKYRAQNYLNSKIEEFENRKKVKSSSVA